MESTQLKLLVDKRNIRWFKILLILEATSQSSTNELSELLQITTRTIISDIKIIKVHFEHIVTIDSTKMGYAFKIHDKVAYINKKKELLEYEPILAILSGIFYGKSLSISEWAKYLFFSEQTLRSHLKKLDSILAQYRLKITYPNINIEGKEIDIRNFFLAFFYEEDTLPHYVFPSNKINDILNDIFQKEFEYFHIDIPRFRFSYLLFITYQRILCGYQLELDTELIQVLADSQLVNTMKQLNISFRKHTSISLNSSDLTYLILMILDSNSYNDYINLAPINRGGESAPVLPMILEFCEDLDISPDKNTIEFIRSFFYINYLKNMASVTCVFLPPSLISYYKKNYKEELKSMRNFIKKYTKKFKLENSNQFEYTLLLFSLRSTYKLKHKSYTIAFLFEGSAEFTVLLEDLARAYIPSNHKLYFFYADTPLANLTNLSINLVVTNFSEYLSEIPDGVDYLLFSYNPTLLDWNKLIEYIDPQFGKKYMLSFVTD